MKKTPHSSWNSLKKKFSGLAHWMCKNIHLPQTSHYSNKNANTQYKIWLPPNIFYETQNTSCIFILELCDYLHFNTIENMKICRICSTPNTLNYYLKIFHDNLIYFCISIWLEIRKKDFNLNQWKFLEFIKDGVVSFPDTMCWFLLGKMKQ